MQVLNLDKIQEDDKSVTLGGKNYIIPGNLPVSIMMRLIETTGNVQTNPGDTDNNRKSIELLYDVFCMKNKMGTLEEFQDVISMDQYVALIGFVFGGLEEAEKKLIPDQEDTQQEMSA